MTLPIAGNVDVELRTFMAVGGGSIVFFFLLLCYCVARRISRGQLLILSCFYLAAVLLFMWLLSVRIPGSTLDAGFYRLQPYLSVGIALAAALFAPNAFLGHTHK